MPVFRTCSVFAFLLGSSLVSSKCNKSTAAQLEEELREMHETALHTQTLYDGGDILKWNCTDDKNQSSPHQKALPSQEEPAESYVSPVAVEESPIDSGIFVTSPTGNSSRINTFVLVYKNIFEKIFDSRKDESYAPSSKIPVQVAANATSEGSTAPRPPDGTTVLPVQHQLGLESTTTRNTEGTSEQTNNKDGNLVQDQKCSNNSAHNIPVRILLGEQHGITILNATCPENSILINKTDIDAFDVDYKFATGTIIFAGNGAIRSTGQPRVVVATGVDGPVRLAVDWVHDRLYWLSDRHQTVEAADLDGVNRALLTDVIRGIKFPNNIAVDPYRRLLFFVANNTVYRSDLEGANLVRIDPRVSTPRTVRCLALDISSKRIFISGKLNKTPRRPYIASSDYDGEAVKDHDIGDTDWKDVYSMDVFRDVLYFAHYSPRLPDSLWLFNTSWTGKRPTKVYEAPVSRGGIWSIKVFHSEVQKQSDKLGK